MFRCWALFDYIIDDLMDAAEAMADGSYWDDGGGIPEAEYESYDPSEWG
jgi:hypothetical protein